MGRGRAGDGVELRERSIRICFTWNGRRYRETLLVPPTPTNEKRARSLAQEIRRKVDLGRFVYAEYFPDSPHAKQQAPTTFGRLSELWLASKGTLEDATKDQYATAVRFWMRMFGADTLVSDLDHKTVAAKIGSFDWKSPRQHNNYLIALRGIFGLEYRGARMADDPTFGLENRKVVRRKPDPFTQEEREAILNDLHARYDLRVWAYFAWQFHTGMRPEETIALRWSDVDFNRSRVRVCRVRTFRGSERDGSKTHAERDVELTELTMTVLKLMKPYTFMKGADHEIFERPPWAPGSKGGKPSVAGPWHDERSQRELYWNPTLKRLGIRRRTPYHTRHTYCTLALMGGLNAEFVAKQAGHSARMLHEVYSTWIDGADKGVQRKLLEQALGGSVPEFVPELSPKIAEDA